MSIKEYARELIGRDQVFRDIAEQTETLWINDKYLPFDMVEDTLCYIDEYHESLLDSKKASSSKKTTSKKD